MNCTLCQGRSEGGNARAPKSPNNTASTFFNTVQLLPKDLRFEYGGAKLASCLGRIQPRYAAVVYHVRRKVQVIAADKEEKVNYFQTALLECHESEGEDSEKILARE